MPIPNIKQAETMARMAGTDSRTIICQSCKKPLWTLSNFKHYGTKWSCDKEAFEGVPEYNDIWSKDGTSCSECLCWFCGEPWGQALKDDKGNTFFKPTVLEELV